MPTSSCPNEDDVRKMREQEIEDRSEKFLHRVILNLLSHEGMSGRIDSAFKVDRKPIIAKVLRKIAEDLENGRIVQTP